MRTLQIRDERARELAQQLATRRRVTMTEAVIQALEGELNREKEKEPLASRLKQIATALAAEAKPGGKPMTKDEIDEMWGH
ncbi:MAG: transcriptional regulator [Rhizobiales bacterium 17-65-6]|jgi:antitoxin VapB|nr:MAG: transcriptional regulator [Rhizobiales bacterium 32-66-11]OYY86645.1 MAG: transcriptional regulator [Rhizobiales bacterium 35-66-30]OYZ89897.1 MAG: transcriptional regulator [Rhizobiales bacterium 17-65-6]OZB04183.1 MAG: transcriptional regulator [Rhizobiales bacterium 39-66-18]